MSAADHLFIARMRGERPDERWVTLKEANRLRVVYEREGWTVEIRTPEQQRAFVQALKTDFYRE